MATTIKTSAELFGTQTSAELFGDKNVATDEDTPPTGDRTLSNDRLGSIGRAAYQSSFDKGSDWDSFVPSEERTQNRALMGDKRYEETGKRIVNSLYFADVYGLDPVAAEGIHNQLGEQTFGVKDTPEGYFGRIGNRLENGQLNIKVMDAGHDFLKRYLTGKSRDPEQIQFELDRISKLQSKLNQDELRETRAWHEKMVGATAEQLPFLFEGIKGGVRGAAVGGGTGAVSALAIGALIPAPEEVLTVPSAAIYGAKVGGATGAGLRIAELKSGELFSTLLEMEDADGNRIDPKIAAIVAMSGGLVEGAIEVAELATLAATFGVGTKIFEGAARRVTSKFLAEGTLKHVITKHLIKYGATLTAETAQELVQEASSVFHEELAKEINNATQGTDIKPITAAELGERMKETTVESLRGFALLVAPGPIVTATAQGIKTTASQKAEQIGKAEPAVGVAPDARAIPPIEETPLTELTPELALQESQDAAVRQLEEEGKIEPAQAKPERKTIEQAVKEEDLSLEETAAIKRLETDVIAEDAEVVKPNLYIGNVTKRMKDKFARIFDRQPDEIKGFTEEGFPTKRTGIEMTRTEAQEYLNFLEEDLLDRLDNNKINTENDLAQANADWGDIKALRESLGQKIGARPFKVVRAKKHKGVTIDRSISLEQQYNKAELVELAKGLDIDSTGTKKQIIRRIEEAADKGMTEAQRIVSEAQEKAKSGSVKIIKSTKALIKEAVRPTEEANMTVGQVLGNTMKRIAQAARKAYFQGGKENIAKLKAQLREARERLRFKRALEKRVRDLVKGISKPVGKDVEYFYRKAIELLQSEFDPKRRSPDAKRRLRKYRDFLKRATPKELAQIPEKKLLEWGKKNYEDFTVAELEQLSEQIETLRRLGKTKQIALNNQRKKTHDENVSKMTENITGSPDLAPQPPHAFETDKEGRIKKLLMAHLQALRIPRILDWLDGRKGTFKGLAYKLFYGRTNEQYDAELRARDERATNLKNKQESLGITTKELTAVIDFSEIAPGLKLMVEEMMGIYTALKNNLSIDALENGNKITEAQALAIVSNLDKKFRDMADYIMDDYANNYARLREAHIEFTDEDMGHEAHYTPIVRLLQNDQVSTDEITKQLEQRASLKRGYEEKGFTKDRKNISPEHQQRMDLRLVTTWHGQMAKQEHYIHFALLTKDMRSYLANPKLKRAITNKLGKEGMIILDKWVDRVANPNIYKGMTGLARWSRIMRGNVALAYLTYNLVTVAKQVPSAILYMADSGTMSFVTSVLDFISNPKKMWNMVREKDPQVKHVHLERELEEFRLANKAAHDKIVRKVGLAGMKGILFMDGIVRTIGWNAVYQKNKDLGMGEAEAIMEAQGVTLRTQPAAHAKDIANLYASDEYLNWFTMFTNQLNQIYNIVSYDVFASWNNHNYRMAAAKITGVGLNALVIWSIANKQLPEDEGDLLDAALEGFLNAVPLIGKTLMSTKDGYGSDNIAPLSAVAKAYRVLSDKDKEKAALAALEGIAALKGFPVVGIKRMMKFLESGDPAELFGKPKKSGGITI